MKTKSCLNCEHQIEAPPFRHGYCQERKTIIHYPGYEPLSCGSYTQKSPCLKCAFMTPDDKLCLINSKIDRDGYCSAKVQVSCYNCASGKSEVNFCLQQHKQIDQDPRPCHGYISAFLVEEMKQMTTN